METKLGVFCAGAVKSAITDVVRSFESGGAPQFTFGPVGSLQAKAAREPVDVLILTRPVLEQMALQGKVLADTIIDLGSVGIGIAVRDGVPSPDVSTPDALRTSLLAATSLSYGDPAHGDSSGVHFAAVLERLGIASEVAPKAVLAPLGLAVAEYVANGEAQIGATQASVILARKGIKLAGMLPADLQHITTYSAAVVRGAPAFEAATRFVSYLSSPAAKSKFERAGFQQGEKSPRGG